MKYEHKLINFFLEHAKKHKERFLTAFAMMPVCAILAVLGPMLVQRTIDEGVALGKMDVVVTLALCYLAVVILNFSLTTFQMLLMQTAGVRTLTDIRSALLKHISHITKRNFEKRPLGVFVNRATSDVEAVGETIATGLTNLITDVLTMTAIFVVIFYQHLLLGFLTVLLLPLIIVIVNFFRKKLRFHHNNVRTIHGKLTAQLNETCSMLYEVNNFHLAGRFREAFAKDNQDYMDESVKAISYDALIYSILEGLSFLVIGFVLLFIGKGWFQSSAISIGQLIMYLQLLEVLFTPVKQMGQRFATIQAALSALDKIDGTISLEVIKDHGSEEIRGNQIDVQNISFGYLPDRLVLKNVSFKVPERGSLAIVGPTGSGKTTLAKLLTRQYDVPEGKIQIGGKPIEAINRKNFKNLVALVPQDPMLFHESVYFNVCLGKTDIPKGKVREACEKVRAHTFIEKLPKGYDTVLLDEGGQLSSGQKQLLALASVLVLNTKVLIFDEATASIDTQTEIALQKGLEYIMSQKTMIIIAHRLSTIRHVDQILVLKSGRIAEEGNHKTLLRKKGLYSKMYEMQSLKV